MTLIEGLLDRAEEGGPDREHAVRELLAFGADTANAILDRVERRSNLLVPWSNDLLLDSADVSVLPRALAALATMPSAVGCTAYPLLGRLGDAQATTPLLAHLLDDELGPSFRVLAAEALAEIGDPAVRAPIRNGMARWFQEPGALDRMLAAAAANDARVLMPPIAAIVTLAALGDQEHAARMFELASVPKRRLLQLPEIRSVLPWLGNALGHLAGPGLIPACRSLQSLLAEETKEELAAVLARIGTREAIELLVKMTRSRRRATAEVASGWLHVVAGAPLVEEDFAAVAAAWWKHCESALVPGVVYLRGAPWTVARFFAEVENLDPTRGDVELAIVMGVHAAKEQRLRSVDRARLLVELAAQFTDRLPAGRLHRYGHSFDAAPPGTGG